MSDYVWLYDHQDYINDMERKEIYKKGLLQVIKQGKISFLKKRKAIRLVNELQKLTYLLDEPIQTEMMQTEEVWGCDCLEYRVDLVCDYINEMSIKVQSVNVKEVFPFCQVHNNVDIRRVKMTDSLRKSKSRNPIIILVNEMFARPFIINGNHRIMKAFKMGIKEIELYIINSDEVVDCLISEDYIKAYSIYKKLYALIGVQLMC